jgi:hypothetical protein
MKVTPSPGCASIASRTYISKATTYEVMTITSKMAVIFQSPRSYNKVKFTRLNAVL